MGACMNKSRNTAVSHHRVSTAKTGAMKIVATVTTIMTIGTVTNGVAMNATMKNIAITAGIVKPELLSQFVMSMSDRS